MGDYLLLFCEVRSFKRSNVLSLRESSKIDLQQVAMWYGSIYEGNALYFEEIIFEQTKTDFIMREVQKTCTTLILSHSRLTI